MTAYSFASIAMSHVYNEVTAAPMEDYLKSFIENDAIVAISLIALIITALLVFVWIIKTSLYMLQQFASFAFLWLMMMMLYQIGLGLWSRNDLGVPVPPSLVGDLLSNIYNPFGY